MYNKEIKKLLSSESASISKLHKIVAESIDQEKLIINNLVHPIDEMLTPRLKAV